MKERPDSEFEFRPSDNGRPPNAAGVCWAGGWWLRAFARAGTLSPARATRTRREPGIAPVHWTHWHTHVRRCCRHVGVSASVRLRVYVRSGVCTRPTLRPCATTKGLRASRSSNARWAQTSVLLLTHQDLVLWNGRVHHEPGASEIDVGIVWADAGDVTLHQRLGRLSLSGRARRSETVREGRALRTHKGTTVTRVGGQRRRHGYVHTVPCAERP